jgi:hypothetical protein
LQNEQADRWAPVDGDVSFAGALASARPSEGAFAKACRALSLATHATQCGALLMGDSTSLELLPREVPCARVIKGVLSRASLVVTNFGRMIWCTDREEGRCLDIPFGEAVIVQHGVLRGLITEHLAGDDWSGIDALGGALVVLPSLRGLAVT